MLTKRNTIRPIGAGKSLFCASLFSAHLSWEVSYSSANLEYEIMAVLGGEAACNIL